MTYRVFPVSNGKQMDDFLHLPFVIYRHDAHWVPSLISETRRVLTPEKNPYFRRASLKLFICYKRDIPISRTAVIIHPAYESQLGRRIAFFGFFESIPDSAAVLSLFEEASTYCREQNVERIEGPFNPNHYSELGLQVSHFDTPVTFFQTHNPPYYSQLLEMAGFRVSRRLHTQKNEEIKTYLRKVQKSGRGSLGANGYRIRPLRVDDLENELERIREVNNDAFSSNWRFLPLDREEYEFSAKFLKFVTFPELIQIVERESEPVGVLHCVLDINPLLKKMKGRAGPIKYVRFLQGRKRVGRIIIFSVGIKRAHQHTAVYQLLLEAFCRVAQRFQAVETTWMSDENTAAVNAARHLGMTPDKEFVIYEKRLSP